VQTATSGLLVLALVFVAARSGSARFGGSSCSSRSVRRVSYRLPIRRHRLCRALDSSGACRRPAPAVPGGRQDGLPFTATFATIVMERVLDLIAVLA
jgi:hypothetical protein